MTVDANKIEIEPPVAAETNTNSVEIGSIDPLRKLALIFTCTVCNTRNARTFSYLSYTKGVVIATCDGCKKHHLVADNLGWFRKTPVNAETLAQEQGEEVRRVDLQYLLNDDVYNVLPKSLKEKVDKAFGREAKSIADQTGTPEL